MASNNNDNNTNSNSNQGGRSGSAGDESHGIDNTVKNPDNWKTGDEPMTGAQRSYLHTLAEDAKEPVDDNMTKAEASKKIDELRQETGVAGGNHSGQGHTRNRE